MRLYYDSKRGKSGKKLSVGSFALYPDFHETDDDDESRAELEAQLGKFAVRSNG